MKRYTSAELAFVKRRKKMPRRELLRTFKRKFRRPGFSLLRLQDLCNRNGWGVGSLKGRTKGRSSRFSKAELAFVKRRRKWPRKKLHAAFVKKFRRRDVSLDHLRQLCMRRGWKGASRAEIGQRRIGRSTAYTKAELAWIKRHRKMPRQELHALFFGTFARTVSQDALHATCLRHGWLTGRDGGYEKGHLPANKGKKMPYNANNARTQFKKGNRSGRAIEVYKPVGSERFSKDGYRERKIHDGMPFQSRWRGVHLVNWEKRNGSVPTGHVLKCLDGNRLNTKASNWELISRAVLARLNKSGHRYDAAPADLKPAIMAIAKLRDRIGERSKRT